MELGTAALLILVGSGVEAGNGAGSDGAFTLGQIVVTGRREREAEASLGGVSSESIRLFDRPTLDDALKLVPGVTASNSGGSRNERLIFVRGFDRLQVPLSIDGIRVYLPADNRLDFGRFLTPDVAEVQVAKGQASLLDGPGALGGAINLVTRKPQKEWEAEGRATLRLDRNGGHAGHMLFALAGARRERWYAQASYTLNVQDHWDLAGDFRPTANEDGGARDRSDARDWRVNAKIGFTPGGEDEYALSYTRQEGEKNAPLHVSDPLSLQRFWRWPDWNIDSLYFLSTTRLGEGAALKTRLYRNRFDNLLRAFDGAAQDRQSLGRAFNSFYEDRAYGGSAELSLAPAAGTSLAVAAHYRRDRHAEYQQVFPSRAVEPRQRSVEDTMSLAAEATITLQPGLDLRLGGSRDWRDLRRAEDFGPVPGSPTPRLFSYPTRDSAAWNGQAELRWRTGEASEVHLGISSRTRFPTLFERFSSRFGGATSNPDLGPERALNLELGGSHDLGRVRMEGALFHSRLSDTIVSVPTLYYPCTGSTTPPPAPVNGCTPQAVSQSRNAGKGSISGGELALNADLADNLGLSAGYAFVRKTIDDPANAAFRSTGVPRHSFYVQADWRPTAGTRVLPQLEFASSRWTVNTAGTLYYRTGGHLLANLSLEQRLDQALSLTLVARNLFDADYRLTDGFPEPGRSFSATIWAAF